MCWGYINQSVDAHHGLVSMPYVVNGRRDLYVFGGASCAGACVSWYRDQFCQAEIEAAKAAERAAAQAGNVARGDAHALLEQAAAQVPAGSGGVIFLPYLMGERSPIWDAEASGAFVGLNLVHTRAHLYRAVLEGVAFALAHNIEAGRKGAQSLDERLIVVGGAAHSSLWMQIIADVTGFPVFTIEEEVEAAMGAALLAAIGAGLATGDAAARGWVTLREHARPDPARQAVYARQFEVYKGLYPALQASMHRLRENQTDR
jgi:xylulokinase